MLGLSLILACNATKSRPIEKQGGGENKKGTSPTIVTDRRTDQPTNKDMRPIEK